MNRHAWVLAAVAATASLCLAQGVIRLGPATASQPGAGTLTFATASAPAPSSQPASGPADGWTKLYQDEPWYKQQAGEEKTFSGKLQPVTPPEISTLQRDSYYQLGDRMVYTGGKKVDALDKLVGKTIEIRGKAYNIQLEGHGVSEIWPAAVRERP